MSIKFNDNIKINAGKPADAKYLNSGNTTYNTVGEVNITIPISERHIGLTVNVLNDEYWFATGVTNTDIVLKQSSTGSVIAGAQNVGSGVGLYSGVTGGGLLNFRSIVGSGDTVVSLSGDTIILNSTGGTSLSDDIFKYDDVLETFLPYPTYPSSAVTFYYGGVDPTGHTRLNLNAKLKVSEISLSTGHTDTGYTHNTGDIFWDVIDGTVVIQQSDSVRQQVGQELFVKVNNPTNQVIPNGAVVYISGTTSGRAAIDLARASDTDVLIADQVLGIATEEISSFGDGFVTTSGLVRDIDTSAYTEGDTIYLSTTIWGGMTDVKPTFPDYAISIGIVTYSHAVNGVVLVKIDNVSTTNTIRGIEIVVPPFTASTRSEVISVAAGGNIFLPATPITGQEIIVIDHDGDASTNNITVNGNGKNINGDTIALINTDYGTITFLFNGIRWATTVITS